MHVLDLYIRKAEGKYELESKFGALKIIDDKEVDSFMASYPTSRTSSKVYHLNCGFCIVYKLCVLYSLSPLFSTFNIHLS